jgi:hypothetical protein
MERMTYPEVVKGLRAAGVQIIGIHGKARAGKDSLAELICQNHSAVRLALADPLKRGLAAMLDIPVDELDDRYKTQEIPLIGVSGRRMMQTLGTEWRDMVHKDLWVRRLAERMLRLARNGHRRFVVSDVRFDHEARWVHSLGGMVVEVIRDAQPETGEVVSFPERVRRFLWRRNAAPHRSEAGIRSGLVDRRIINWDIPAWREHLANEAIQLGAFFTAGE